MPKRNIIHFHIHRMSLCTGHFRVATMPPTITPPTYTQTEWTNNFWLFRSSSTQFQWGFLAAGWLIEWLLFQFPLYQYHQQRPICALQHPLTQPQSLRSLSIADLVLLTPNLKPPLLLLQLVRISTLRWIHICITQCIFALQNGLFHCFTIDRRRTLPNTRILLSQ